MSISSKKKKPPQTRNITLSDGTVVKANDNNKKHIKSGELTKHVVRKKPFSTETGVDEDSWEVTDDLDNSPYPPPSKNPHFRKFWSDTIDNITNRVNFQHSHLAILEAWCRIRVELRALDKFIQENGHTFRVVTALGEHRKTYPEVHERHKALSHLAQYSKMLDLLPKKDKSKSAKRGEEEDDWE